MRTKYYLLVFRVLEHTPQRMFRQMFSLLVPVVPGASTYYVVALGLIFVCFENKLKRDVCVSTNPLSVLSPYPCCSYRHHWQIHGHSFIELC